MKFAVIDGQRREAQPSLSGACPFCAHQMIAKCGEVRIWHWAHQGASRCDPWWEETEWHLTWKAEFPDAWQEVVHFAADGTKHIADVKTEHGWVIEFQHSPLKPEERQSRDAFYGQLVWVVDGARIKRDAKQFARAWDDGMPVTSDVRRLLVDDCALLLKWSGSLAPIFFDFGEPVLWWLLPGRFDGAVYVAQFRRDGVIHMLRGGAVQEGPDFSGLVKKLGAVVATHEAAIRARRSLGSSAFVTRGSHPRFQRRHRRL